MDNINERTKCEVYSRVVGYLSPISHWNDGKKAEFNDRQAFTKQIEDLKNE